MKITVRDLSISLENEKILNHLQMDLESSSFVTVLSNDDRLAQAFLGVFAFLIPFEGEVIVDHQLLSKKTMYTKKMSFLFHHQHQHLWGETVSQHFILKCKDPSLEKLHDLRSLLVIDALLEKRLETLSASQKQLITIIDAYIESPSILFLEDPFFRMDEKDRKIAFQILKKLNKKLDTIIIHFTSNVEDILKGDFVYLFQDGSCIDQGPVSTLLDHEKSFLKIGYDLPFMASLSHKLSYYNLTKNPVLKEKEMIEILWKSK